RTRVVAEGTPAEVITPAVLEQTFGASMEVYQHDGLPVVLERYQPGRAPPGGGGCVSGLLDPYQYEFFVKGLLVATLAGGLCGLVGVYITLRGMSYIGHGLSHAIFGGFAAASIISLNYFVGAGIWGLASALAINRVTRRRAIGADAAIGVITTASFALGVALLTKFGNRGPSFDAALFGSIVGVGDTDLLVIAGVTLFAAAVVVLRYRALLFATFDPEVAARS